MGLGLVPCGIQRLSLAPSQSCSIPSFNRPRCPALPHQTPCPAQQIQHPWCGQLFPTQRPPKIQFAFPCHQPAIFTAGEEAAVEEGGSLARQSRAAGMLHQHAEPRASSTVAGQRLAHPDKLLRGKVEIQPQK